MRIGRWMGHAGPAGTALVTALLVLAPHDAVVGQDARTVRLEGPRVALYNLAGRLEVVRGSGPDVVVRVTPRGRDAGRLEVLSGTLDGRATLRIRYPDDRVVYPEMGRGSRTQLSVSDEGVFGRGGRGGDRVEIRGSGSGMEAWADLRVEVPPGRALDAWVAAGDVTAEGVEGDLLLDTGSGDVDVRDVRGALLVDTGSGNVTVAGVDGEVNVDTGSGNVRANDLRGPRILIDTGSGRVEGSGMTSPSVRIDTGSGSIRVDRIASPDIYLDTGSGSVDVELTEDVERLDVDTGSGSVTVRVPDDLGAEIEVETGSGGIDFDFPVELRRMGRNHVEGRVGDGRGRIRIDTGSGGVRLIRN